MANTRPSILGPFFEDKSEPELIDYYMENEIEIISHHETVAYQEVKYIALRKYKYLASIMEIEPKTHSSWYQLLIGITTYLNASAMKKKRLRVTLIQVCLILYLCVMSVSCIRVKQSENGLIFTTNVTIKTVTSKVEPISLTPYKEYLIKTDNMLKDIEIYKNYSLSTYHCPNEPLKDSQLNKIFKNKRNSIRVEHNENSIIKNFIIWTQDEQCYFALNEHGRQRIQTIVHYYPRNEYEQIDYRQHLQQYFRDTRNNSCLKHGSFKKELYSTFIQTENIAECALICNNKYHLSRQNNLMRQITREPLGNLTSCTAFSFDMKNKHCYLSEHITYEILTSQNDYYNGPHTLSGGYDCTFTIQMPFLVIEKNSIDVNKICVYNTQKPEAIYKSCPVLYETLKFKILMIKDNIESFMQKYSKQFTFQSRNKRSLLKLTTTVAATITTEMLKSAIFNRRKIFVESKCQILKEISKTLQKLGASSQLIKNNTTKLLNPFILESIGQNIITMKKINQLAKEGFRLKNYYRELKNSPNPRTREIKEFIQNETFVYTIYKDKSEIYRGFIIEKDSKIGATQISYMPLTDFNIDRFWQTNTYIRSKTPNVCLTELLRQRNYNKECVDTSAIRITVMQNIFKMPQTEYNKKSELWIFNREALVEISCYHQESLLKRVTGLTVIYLGDGCTVTINLLIIQQRQSNDTNQPKILYEQAYFMEEPIEIQYHDIINSIGSIILMCFIIICFIGLNMIKKQITYSHVNTNDAETF